MSIRLRAIETTFGVLLTAREDSVSVTSDDLDDLRAAVVGGAPTPAVLRLLEGWSDESLPAMLGRLAEQSRAFGRREGRGDLTVLVDAPRVRFPNGRLDGLAA